MNSELSVVGCWCSADEDVELTFHPDGRLTLILDPQGACQPLSLSWHAVGDRLVIGKDGSSDTHHKFRINGSQLVLDRDGAVSRYQRS